MRRVMPTLELFQERFDAVVYRQGAVSVKVGTLAVIAAVFVGVVEAGLRWGGLATACWVAVLSVALAWWVELKLRTNPGFAGGNVAASVRQELRSAETGDLVFFRSYHSYDVPEFLFYRCAHALVSSMYFGHVGMLVRPPGDDDVFIVECTEDEQTCALSGRSKTGVIYHDAYRRIKAYEGRVHLVRTGLRLPYESVMRHVRGRRHLSFLEDGVGCCNFVRDILIECGAMKRTPPLWIPNCAHMLDASNYAVPVKFRPPVELVSPTPSRTPTLALPLAPRKKI